VGNAGGDGRGGRTLLTVPVTEPGKPTVAVGTGTGGMVTTGEAPGTVSPGTAARGASAFVPDERAPLTAA